MKTISSRLQHLMDQKKINQSGLATHSKVSRTRINLLLNEKVDAPQRDTLLKLAEFFGCDIEWLATGKGKPWPSDKNTAYRIGTDEQKTQSQEEEIRQVRMYRKLAQMDEDTLKEVQTWLDDMERLRPGFKGWFRLEFQNRFPEFDDWREKITKNKASGAER